MGVLTLRRWLAQTGLFLIGVDTDAEIHCFRQRVHTHVECKPIKTKDEAAVDVNA